METNDVNSVMQHGEKRMNKALATTALDIVSPFLDQCEEDIASYVSTDKIIVIMKSSENSPMSIVVLDKKEDFTIKGGGEKFVFTGAPVPGTNKLKALLKFFTAKEFVGMLIGGKMDELTAKLTA